jgi:serine/threonine protein kinase
MPISHISMEVSPHNISGKRIARGTIIADRYQIEDHIADGGMASVYHARDLTNMIEEDIAIKILHHSLLTDETHLERFLQEAKLLTRIHHPAIIELLDVGTSGEYVYICMPYVKTPNLEQIIYSRGVPQSGIWRLLHSICEALDVIHNMGIIHRDLKPANILVNEDYSVKITDFGIARIKESRLTSPKQKVGSMPYIAPEAWMGEPPTPALDFYALGVCMYEVITQTNPFQSELPAEVMKMHLGPLPPSPRVLTPSTPNWLNDLVIWLLQRKPQNRPKSASKIIEYLNEHPQVHELHSNHKAPSITDLPVEVTRKAQRSKTYVLSLSGANLSANLRKYETGIAPESSRAPTVVINLPNNAAFVFEFEAPSRDIVCAGLLLASLQVMDGYLTSMGIHYFGIQAEGNIFIKKLMHLMGPDNALIVVKGLAIVVVFFLTALVRRQRNLKGVINGLCLIYLLAAIIPWIYILTTKNPAI